MFPECNGIFRRLEQEANADETDGMHIMFSFVVIPFILEIQETITKIEVITDTIEINQGETVIEADCALALHTNKSTYTFARTEWFSEVIFILHNKDYNELFPVQKVEESWCNDGENKVNVKRKATVIA